MGIRWLDQFSLLHVAVGIIAYFWGVSFWIWILIHTVFEYLENTRIGMHFINTYLTIWPGGKNYPDSFINSFGDLVMAIIGWSIAYYLDLYGSNQGWYQKHLNKRLI